MRHFLLSAALALGSVDASAADLTVSAAASLQDALTEIKTAYEAKSKDKLTLNFGASGALAQQIQAGAPVDAFVSAAAKPMDDLEKAGKLKDGSRAILARNTLVLIALKDKALGLKGMADLGTPGVKKIAVGEPATVPAGQYAEAALTRLKLLDAVKPKLVFGQNVRQVLTYVESGNVDAGVVYATDARSSEKVRIVATVDGSLHDPIVYPSAVIAASKNAEAAQRFLAYLAGPEGQAVLARLGFLPGKDPS